MLYLSSACVKHEKIKDSVEELAANGFKNIELSGGTKYYPGCEQDLLKLQEQYGLNYLVHNYFPPPQEDFVLNLASRNEETYQKSLRHCRRAIALSRKLGARKFGLHAGFFIEVKIEEIGKNISSARLADQEKAMRHFCEAFNSLKETSQGVELYLENNVMSLTNRKNFQGQRPFMLMDHDGYLDLKDRIEFKLLLDVAHLNVSARSLGLDLIGQLNKMMPLSDYVHLSDNDGWHDQSRCFSENSGILNILKNYDLKNKVITSETCGSISDIKLSQSILKQSLGIKE